MFSLDGRTALVTGAGRGVGAGIARALAEQGAFVVVNDLFAERAENTAKEIGGRARACAFDVTDAAAIQHVLGSSEIDILVNNAGVPADGMALESFRDMSPDDWERFVELNLYGVLRCTRAVLDGMCERSWGRIITISSEAGRVGIPIGVALYGAAKAAAIGFTRHLALEVAGHGVTANCITLGAMDNIPPEALSSLTRNIPRGRAGSPLDAGAAVAYLASEEASWVTGQTLPVNGGTATN